MVLIQPILDSCVKKNGPTSNVTLHFFRGIQEEGVFTLLTKDPKNAQSYKKLYFSQNEVRSQIGTNIDSLLEECSFARL